MEQLTQKKDDDWRMFPADLLYSEGKLRPVFRGYIHAAALAGLLPFVFFAMWEDIDKRIEYYALLVLVGGTIICWGTSTLFHCFLWSPKQEILLQRIGKSCEYLLYYLTLYLDHSAVFLQIGCNCTPIALLVLHDMHIHPRPLSSLTVPHISLLSKIFSSRVVTDESSALDYILLFILVNLVVVWSFGVYGVWHVFHRRGQRLLFWIFMIVLTFPSYPLLSAYMTLHERCLFLLVLFINLIGACIFGTKLRFLNNNQYYQKIAPIFGYHEIFHVLTVVGCLMLYLVADSLILNEQTQRCSLQLYFDETYPVLRLWKDWMVFLRITSRPDICTLS